MPTRRKSAASSVSILIAMMTTCDSRLSIATLHTGVRARSKERLVNDSMLAAANELDMVKL